MTVDQYVNTVLDVMPADLPSRAQIATDLRAHIAEGLEHGHPLDDVLRQLGDPAKLADSYLSAEPLMPAPHGARLAAKLVDVVTVLIAMVPLGWLLSRVVGPDYLPVFLIGFTTFCGSFALGLYTGIAEFQLGHTFGKRWLGLRVVQESGRRISAGQALVRQISLFFSYSIDLLFIPFTEKHQRAFELLSKTRVVSVCLLASLLAGSFG